MEFRRLNTEEGSLFEEAFALYGTSFPPHEQHTLAKQRALMPDPAYHFDALLLGGAFACILLYWVFDGYAYIEHFAANTVLRGQTVGSRALAAFCAAHPLVVLEIDPPCDEVSRRREHFYKSWDSAPTPTATGTPPNAKRPAPPAGRPERAAHAVGRGIRGFQPRVEHRRPAVPRALTAGCWTWYTTDK